MARCASSVTLAWLIGACATLAAASAIAGARCGVDTVYACPPAHPAAAAKARVSAELVGSTVSAVGGQGTSVAVSRDTVVVGSPFDNNIGAAFVFVRSGTGWIQQAKLVGPGLEPNPNNPPRFAERVAIDGDTIAVSNPVEVANGLDRAGAVYVFVRAGGGWTLQQKLVGESSGDFLGSALGLDGNDLAVGEPGADFGSNFEAGAMRIYTRTGTTWTQQQRLFGDGAASEIMGRTLAIRNGVVLAATGGGFVYVFRRTGSTWSQDGRLQVAGIALDGASLAFDGNVAAVGTPQNSVFPPTGPGVVHLFARSNGVWLLTDALVPASAPIGGAAGTSVAIEGDTLLVGSPGPIDGSQFGGKVTTYLREGSGWIESHTVESPFAAGRAIFGQSMAMYRRRAVVGAPAADTGATQPTGAAIVLEGVGRVFIDGFE